MTSGPGWEVEQRQPPPPPPERERQERSRLGNPKVPATLHGRLPSSFMGKVWKQQMYPQYATYYYPQYLQAKVKGRRGWGAPGAHAARVREGRAASSRRPRWS